MAKKTIRVHTPFTFNNEDGTSQKFEPGEYTVEDKVADHWFVTAHSEVTGKAKASADSKEAQAQIDSLTTQLAEREKTIGDLQQSVSDKDAEIASLNEQLTALQAPAEVITDGEKPKSSDSK